MRAAAPADAHSSSKRGAWHGGRSPGARGAWRVRPFRGATTPAKAVSRPARPPPPASRVDRPRADRARPRRATRRARRAPRRHARVHRARRAVGRAQWCDVVGWAEGGAASKSRRPTPLPPLLAATGRRAASFEGARGTTVLCVRKGDEVREEQRRWQGERRRGARADPLSFFSIRSSSWPTAKSRAAPRSSSPT